MKLDDYIYYKEPSGVIYCGDCLEILPLLAPGAYTCYIDPVWPNNTISEFENINPHELFKSIMDCVGPLANRIIVHLGCDSDPRFLNHVPTTYPFVRVIWLRYARPHYKGRVLYGSDVGYLFGDIPKSRPGFRVIPGEMQDASNNGKQADHPCPRKLDHVKKLIANFSNAEDIIFDPCGGSGTSAVAAKILGLRYIIIEIEEKYCEIAKRRLAQEELFNSYGE